MLRTKLTIGNCTILAVVFGSIVASIYVASWTSLFHSVDANLIQRAHLTAADRRGLAQWEQEQLHQVRTTLTIVLPIAVALGVLTGLILTRKTLHPLSHIELVTETLDTATLVHRNPTPGGDELDPSITSNATLAKLQTVFDEKQAALRRQKRFISDASHELKTPLTAILARTGIALGNPPITEELVEHIEAINRAAGLMASVVQDLLLLAAADEKVLRLKKERVAVEELVADALASVDTGKNHVVLVLDPDLQVVCDPSALTRVLVNLLQNSVTHTSEGKEIRISTLASEGGVTMTVQDRGIGIPADHVDQIFERFHRVDRSRDRASGGSGLGLAIAKAIVEAHGGTITLESELGQGTSVSVTVPR